MARAVRDAVPMAMDDLRSLWRPYDKIFDEIFDWRIGTGYGKILRDIISKAGPDDVEDPIRSFHSDFLHAFKEMQVALDLKKDLKKVKEFLSRRQKEPKEEPQSTAKGPKVVVSFVDKNREALIARVAHVAPILDGLISKNMLTTEENDIILAEKVPQEQMRKLYLCIRQWSESDKNTLYEILKKKTPRLIKDLEQS